MIFDSGACKTLTMGHQVDLCTVRGLSSPVRGLCMYLVLTSIQPPCKQLVQGTKPAARVTTQQIR